MLLKTEKEYGVSIGYRTVFTREAVVERYKLFLEVCYGRFSEGSVIALSKAEDDMVAAGFTRDEIEEIEITYLQSLNDSDSDINVVTENQWASI